MPKKKTKPPNPRQSSARAAGKRSGAPSSPSTEPPKRKRVTATGRELVGPDVWYSSAVADSLPMPPRSTLVAVVKPRRRRAIKRTKAKLRKRKRKRKLRKEPRGEVTAAKRSSVPAHQELVAPLLTCMAQVRNFSNSTVPFKVHRGRKRRILSSTARGMLGLCHYSFSELLRYKMERAGGKMITCEEEYTSKTCSGCGKLKENLGGSEVYKCVFCGAHMDRDLNGAKNILIKNIEMLF
ncbi:hypothetical protein PR002_g21877 [Phytophthora rubi]|uniref:Cas12f1-like TNB domain-containing protein n=1 Tax=Phytophthora rubi TaxID=129364 RepID=A0A6A3J745_9STRA|nr:hypothetical protein PR002_g21877 [Phytophthora rubi]